MCFNETISCWGKADDDVKSECRETVQMIIDEL